MKETICNRIVEWNKERKLLDKEYNHRAEVSFIVEELVESIVNKPSEEVRPVANKLTEDLFSSLEDTKETDTKETTVEEKVDAFADIIVFAVGAIAKLKYNPEIIMNEVLKHIESRTGKYDEKEGKFIKDKNVKTYEPDFNLAKNKS
jgi:predicted HAD superfamily Cof-like phosphohydrolase